MGMREGAWLRIEKSRIFLKGLSGALLFTKSNDPVEYAPTKEGLDLTDVLLKTP